MTELSVGAIIKKMRIEAGLTQEQLAYGICATSSLSRIENGSRDPSRRVLQSLIERLGESGYLCPEMYTLTEDITESLCQELISAMELNRGGTIEEQLYMLKLLANESGDVRLKQFTEMIKNIWGLCEGWYEKTEYLNKCMEVFSMNSDHLIYVRGRDIIREIPSHITKIDMLLFNNIAVGHLWNGDAKTSLGVLIHLYRYIKSDRVRNSKYKKTKVVLCNNIAVCLHKVSRDEEALHFITQAIDALQTVGGMQLAVHVLKVREDIYYVLGKIELSKKDRSTIKMLCPSGKYQLTEKGIWKNDVLLMI